MPMWVISLKNKIAVTVIAANLILLILLFFYSLRADNAQCDNLMMISAISEFSRGVSVKQLDELIEDEFLLTYEIICEESVKALNTSHLIEIKETNHAYASVLAYPVLDGSFFTEAAQKEKNRHAVLNEQAAHKLFGSVKATGNRISIKNETWIIVGVIRDAGDELAIIYIPRTDDNARVNTIMALMSVSHTEAYLKSALKAVGIRDTAYEFISLAALAGAFNERFSVAALSLLFAVLFLFAVHMYKRFYNSFNLLKAQKETLYISQIFAYNKTMLAIMLTRAVCAIAAVAMMLVISLKMLEIFLAWRDFTVMSEIAAKCFSQKGLWLYQNEIASVVLFWTSLAFSVCGKILLRAPK